MRSLVTKRGLFYDLYRAGEDNPEELIKKMYLDGYSGQELSDWLMIKYSIKTTAKTIQDWAKKGGYIRKTSEHKKVAISRGRMIYVKKQHFDKYIVNPISSKIRYNVLKRDKSRCQMCGSGVEDGAKLELHHINGKESIETNLKTLCFLCHRGLHQSKK